MLSKLLKYDLRSLFKKMIPIYIAMFLIASLSRGAYYLADSVSLFKIPYGFILTVYIIAMICLPFATWIIGCLRFYNNLIKDEGYLMNTLPVKKSSLILSKLISFVITILVSMIVVCIAVVIGMLGVYFTSNDVSDVFNAIMDFNKEFIVILLLTALVGVIMQQLMIYLAITFGQRHNKNKGAFSFVYMIAIYYVTQIVTSLILIIPMYLNKNWKVYLEQDMPPMRILNNFLLLSLLLSVIISVVYYVITKYNMEKKLNLE